MVLSISKYIVWPILQLYVKEIKGTKNIPKKGAAIIASNHSSYIDGPIIFFMTAYYANRLMRSFVIKTMFNNAFRRLIFKTWLNQIEADHSLKKGVEVLNQKEILGLLPEGGRTRTGRMQPVRHKGLGIIAQMTGAPIIPVKIKGSYDFWPSWQYWPSIYMFKKISITIGKPIRTRKQKPNAKTARKIIEKTVSAILRL